MKHFFRDNRCSFISSCFEHCVFFEPGTIRNRIRQNGWIIRCIQISSYARHQPRLGAAA